MKTFIILLFISVQQISWGSYSMREINIDLLLPGIKRDFRSISQKEEALKKEAVKFLFDNELIGHYGTKAYDSNAQFSIYFEKNENNYQLIDLDRDGIVELIFNGFVDEEKDNENLEIFLAVKNEWLPIFNGKGNLLGYKIQPNTGEILLYQHIYPCCNHGSHNLNRLRLVNSKFQEVRRFFVGREDNMKGQFFPKKSAFNGRFYRLKQETNLFWSPDLIKSSAWQGRVEENKISKYPAGTIYSVLAKQGKWKFVLMHGAPKIEQNSVINPANFSATWIYGWIN